MAAKSETKLEIPIEKCVESTRDQKWQKTHHVTQSFLIDLGDYGYRKLRRVLLPKFLGEGEGRTKFFFFLEFCLPGFELSTVGSRFDLGYPM